MSCSCSKHVIKYYEKVYERSGKNLFWSIENSSEISDKLKVRDFNATSLSTYNLFILLKEPSRETALLTLHVMTEMHFYLGKKISSMVMSKCM